MLLVTPVFDKSKMSAAVKEINSTWVRIGNIVFTPGIKHGATWTYIKKNNIKDEFAVCKVSFIKYVWKIKHELQE